MRLAVKILSFRLVGWHGLAIYNEGLLASSIEGSSIDSEVVR